MKKDPNKIINDNSFVFIYILFRKLKSKVKLLLSKHK
jgi:hypothetical protein